MKLMICFLFLFSTQLWARPKEVTVFFLSTQKVSLQKFLPQDILLYSPAFAAKESNSDENCKKMEGGCFDPQRGFVADKDFKPKKAKPQMGNDGLTGDLVKCEKGNYFDLYCGKSGSALSKKNIPVGIWIDISGSMKDEDVSSDGIFCQRRVFAEKIIQACKHNVAISQFNTSLSTVGSANTLCRNKGTNNTKKMIQWIESSTYKKLYIVTDVEENNMQFAAYLSSIGATSVGIGTEGFYASGLEGYLKGIISSCQK